ncbi:MAG: adenylyltransferase/cytidyltransferase family protein [Anaerolineae bacterium]
MAVTRGMVLTEAEAAETAARLRAEGKRLVLTNGHFDLLHAGHVTYLEAARALGDVLFVGLNSDAGTTRLKGPKRPILPQEERALLLTALRAVDYVVIFEETTADSLLTAIRPDVYAKGGDYTPRTLPEAATAAAVGAEIRLLPLVGGRSTSTVIESIVARYCG